MTEPILLQSFGGTRAFEDLIVAFYSRIQYDKVLAPVFAGMNVYRHCQTVSAYMVEALGGQQKYTEMGGTHYKMLAHHIGKNMTEEQRLAWIALLLSTADQMNMNTGAELRISFGKYLDWITQETMIDPHESNIAKSASIPVWDHKMHSAA